MPKIMKMQQLANENYGPIYFSEITVTAFTALGGVTSIHVWRTNLSLCPF